MAKIESEPALKAAFDTMRNREKTLHFADGYPYYVAYKQGIPTKDMTEKEKEGWGIYHEMIDENGSYAYVVKLSENPELAKYDEFYGTSLTSMTDYGSYLTTHTAEEFTKIISGGSSMGAFDDFVKTFNKNGGSSIVKQVNAWYEAVHKFD